MHKQLCTKQKLPNFRPLDHFVFVTLTTTGNQAQDKKINYE